MINLVPNTCLKTKCLTFIISNCEHFQSQRQFSAHVLIVPDLDSCEIKLKSINISVAYVHTTFEISLYGHNKFRISCMLVTDGQSSFLVLYCQAIILVKMSLAMRKCVLCHMRTTKTQISLHIRAV